MENLLHKTFDIIRSTAPNDRHQTMKWKWYSVPYDIAKPSDRASVELYSTMFTIFYVWLFHFFCLYISRWMFFSSSIRSMDLLNDIILFFFFFNRKRFFLPTIFKFSFSTFSIYGWISMGIFFFYFLVVKRSLSLHKMYRWKVQLTRLNNKNRFSIIYFFFVCVFNEKCCCTLNL